MIEPRPYKFRALGKRLCVFDFETDKFLHGRIPRAFCVGFFDGLQRRVFWGDGLDGAHYCASDFLDWAVEENARSIAEGEGGLCIYAHNGGRFDFMYLMRDLDRGSNIQIINGRIVRAFFRGVEFRDSWALFPQPLSAYQKTKIDYDKFERVSREKHRAEIEAYCLDDCEYLHDILTPFLEEFGDRLTVGSVAMGQLESFYGFERLDAFDDETLRPFFYGGRVQCFERGVMAGEFAMYDANGMYPATMKNVRHPVSGFHNKRRLTEDTGFAIIDATSKGCLPWRNPETDKLDFPHGRGRFFATIHEINAGLELGLLDIHSIETTYEFSQWTTFALFVDKFAGLRLAAKAVEDLARDLIYKRVGNSGYGKFALDPREHEEYYVAEPTEKPAGDGWFPSLGMDDIYQIWARPNPGRLGKFYNVATAASITGGARANLMRTIDATGRVLYCDTDSVLLDAREGHEIDIDPVRPGAWKCEVSGLDRIAIAARKIYALFGVNRDPKHYALQLGEYGCVKKACKGAGLSAEEIEAVARGEIITWLSDAPAWHWARPTGIYDPVTTKEAERLFTLRDIKRDDLHRGHIQRVF